MSDSHSGQLFVAPLLFLGALEQAVPAFMGEKEICPQHAGVLGGEDCFGEEAGGDRWRVMLSSGCKEGVELRRVWNSLQGEERQAARSLDEEMQENLSTRCGRLFSRWEHKSKTC